MLKEIGLPPEDQPVTLAADKDTGLRRRDRRDGHAARDWAAEDRRRYAAPRALTFTVARLWPVILRSAEESGVQQWKRRHPPWRGKPDPSVDLG